MRDANAAIELFGLRIHWYAVLIVLGMALALVLAAVREKRYGLPEEAVLDLGLVCLPTAIVGARLYYVLFNLSAYAGEPFWKVFAVWEGGLAVYGGVMAGILAGWIYAKRKRLPFLKLCDLTAPCIALGQAIGRWGNFVNREAYGRELLSQSKGFFPFAVRIDGIWHYATFFYESVWCILIVVVLLVAEKRDRARRDGDLMLGYLFLYALERACVEGLRTDSLYLGPMRVSQGLSLLVTAAVLLVRLKRRRDPAGAVALAAILAAAAFAMQGCLHGVFVAALIALACTLFSYMKEAEI